MIRICKMLFIFWMNISSIALGKVVLLGEHDVTSELPLQTELDLLWFLFLRRCPQDLMDHIFVFYLCGLVEIQRGESLGATSRRQLQHPFAS